MTIDSESSPIQAWGCLFQLIGEMNVLAASALILLIVSIEGEAIASF